MPLGAPWRWECHDELDRRVEHSGTRVAPPGSDWSEEKFLENRMYGRSWPPCLAGFCGGRMLLPSKAASVVSLQPSKGNCMSKGRRVQGEESLLGIHIRKRYQRKERGQAAGGERYGDLARPRRRLLVHNKPVAGRAPKSHHPPQRRFRPFGNEDVLDGVCVVGVEGHRRRYQGAEDAQLCRDRLEEDVREGAVDPRLLKSGRQEVREEGGTGDRGSARAPRWHRSTSCR